MIDFDANNDGRALAVDFNNLAKLTTDPQAIANLLGRSLRDVAVGVNGTIEADLKSNFSLDVGSASAFYLPNGQVAFRGSAKNPLQNPFHGIDSTSWRQRPRAMCKAGSTDSVVLGVQRRHHQFRNSRAQQSARSPGRQQRRRFDVLHRRRE